MSDDTSVYAGVMPSREGELSLEMHGMAPVQIGNFSSVVAVAVTVTTCFLTLWLNTGDLATKFENVLLFITYWVPPFAAIQMVDWWRKRGVMNTADVVGAVLKPGWDALAALVIGFLAAVPFIYTSLYVGYASAHWLQGGDPAFGVGFVVGLVVYAGIRRAETGTLRDPAAGLPATRQGA
jgi:nucleobase:cation symporter-1, NCS1 family